MLTFIPNLDSIGLEFRAINIFMSDRQRQRQHYGLQNTQTAKSDINTSLAIENIHDNIGFIVLHF